ncbi:MAG: hypothetical protein CME06_11985 [Gemmatimonadetes bacterium]|nr:hypothetical protein [Gemmatimonadota bacterium]
MSAGVEQRLVNRFPELGAEFGSPLLVLIGDGRVVHHPAKEEGLLAGISESSVLSRTRVSLLRGRSQVEEIASGHLFIHPIVSSLGDPIGAVCVAVPRENPGDRTPLPESQLALLSRYLDLWLKDTMGDQSADADEALFELGDDSAEAALVERIEAAKRWVPSDDPMHEDPFTLKPNAPPRSASADEQMIEQEALESEPTKEAGDSRLNGIGPDAVDAAEAASEIDDEMKILPMRVSEDQIDAFDGAGDAEAADLGIEAPEGEAWEEKGSMIDAAPSIIVTVPYQLTAANESATDLVGTGRDRSGVPCYEFLGLSAPCRPCVAVAAHLQGKTATARVETEGRAFLIESTQLIGSDPLRFVEQLTEAPPLPETEPVLGVPRWPPIQKPDERADTGRTEWVATIDSKTDDWSVSDRPDIEREDGVPPIEVPENYLLDEVGVEEAGAIDPREPNANAETAPFQPISDPDEARRRWIVPLGAVACAAILAFFAYRYLPRTDAPPELPPGAIELEVPASVLAEFEAQLGSAGDEAVPPMDPADGAMPPETIESPPPAIATTTSAEIEEEPTVEPAAALEEVGPSVDSPFSNWVAYEVALEFLERADIHGAADAWDAMLESEPKSNSTLMLETNCEEWAARDNLARFVGDTAAILKPIYIDGRKCFLLAYGSFASKDDASVAIAELPEPFRSRATRPIIRSFNLLP